MMLTTTLIALAQAEEALNHLVQLKLGVKSAYHLAKLTRLVKAETQHFHEQRLAWIRELGEEINGVITVTPTNNATFQQRIQELGSVSVSIPWAPLTLEMLDGADTTAADLNLLGPLLADPSPPTP